MLICFATVSGISFQSTVINSPVSTIVLVTAEHMNHVVQNPTKEEWMYILSQALWLTT